MGHDVNLRVAVNAKHVLSHFCNKRLTNITFAIFRGRAWHDNMLRFGAQHKIAHFGISILCSTMFSGMTIYLLFALCISYQMCSKMTTYYCIAFLLLHTMPNING